MSAKVLKQTNGGVEVETCPQKDCGACKVCKPKSEKLFVKTRRKLKKGQLVKIEIDSKYFWRALGLLIFLPVLTLTIVLSALLKIGLSEFLAALIALLICFAEYVAIYFYDRTIKTAELYRII